MQYNYSVPNWAEKLAAGLSIAPDIPLNHLRVRKALAYFDKLKLPDVEGTPSLGQSSGPWLRDLVRLVFGTFTMEGKRYVREFFAMVPKKNAKTTGGAAIMIIALLMNERPRAEFVFVGPTQEVADTAFSQAVGMIEADDDPVWPLGNRFKPKEHRKEIVDLVKKAKLKIKTFDMKVATGSKPAGILIDELHLMSTIAGATRVVGQLRGGMLANPEAFMVMITTQSDIPPAGIFRTELKYARAVRDGQIAKPRVVPMIYEFPEAMQRDEAKPWLNPEMWHQVLPNLGRPFTLQDLMDDFEAEKDKGQENEERWLSQHLNIQIGMATHDDRWVGADYWLGARDESLRDLDAMMERCEVLVVGGDGGGLDDMLGLAVIGRDKKSKDWLLWTHAWVHDDVLVKRPEIIDTLRGFEEDGDLTFCDKSDPTRDIREFCAIVARVHATGKMPAKRGVGLDPYAIGAIIDELASHEILKEDQEGPVFGVGQGSRLSPATWGMERKLKDGTLWHGGTDLMTWCVGNAKTEQRGNAVLITKQTAGKAKIDPLVAAFDAFFCMSLNPQPKPPPASPAGMIRSPVMVI